MPSDISGSFRARTALRAWPLQLLLIVLLVIAALLPLKTEAFYFTKNGVQYVVVTMPELENWLIEILKTWEFTD